MNPKVLSELANETMPFGKYAGRPLVELPIAYLIWMQNKGWPNPPLGPKLALILEIKHNGLGYLLKPLKSNETV